MIIIISNLPLMFVTHSKVNAVIKALKL